MSRAGIFASAVVASPPAGGAVFHTSLVDGVDHSAGVPFVFTNVPIGSASATRRVVVAIGSRSTTLTSCTIGGVSASVDASDTSPNQVYLVSAVVPTGSFADIEITFSATTQRCGIGVWSLADMAPTGQTGTAANDTDMVITTTTGDTVIAAAFENGTIGSTATWTGADERYDETVESDLTHTGADITATGSTTTIRCTFSVTSGAAVSGAAYA